MLPPSPWESVFLIFFNLFFSFFLACVSKVLGRKKEDTKVGEKDA